MFNFNDNFVSFMSYNKHFIWFDFLLNIYQNLLYIYMSFVYVSVHLTETEWTWHPLENYGDSV